MAEALNYINLIRDRHSVRNYEQHPLSAEERQEIDRAIATAVPLQRPELLTWKLADRSPMGCSAVLYAESGSSGDELVEYGYEGEQIVLALLAAHWGTCWYYQMRLPGSPCSITVGRAAGSKGARDVLLGMVARGGTRKPLEALVPAGIPEGSAPQVWTVLSSARLAPSAMNWQPWKFEVVSDSRVIISGDTGRFPDLGICLAHAMLTARQLAGKATVTKLEQGRYSVSW